MEKAFLFGVSHITKSAGLNNVLVYPMHKEFADLGFTEDEISILLQYNNKKDQLDDVRKWNNGFRAGKNLRLYNPWSINSFISDGILKVNRVNTSKFALINFC